MKFFFFTIVSAFILFPFSPNSIYASGWIEAEKGTIQGLQAVTKSGPNYFGVGNGSNIIRSIDGGSSWSVIDQSGNVYWQDVEATGQTIRAIGEGGTMRESIDGGATWKQRSLDISDALYDIDASAGYGYVVGTNGRILYYGLNTDTWHRASSPTSVPLYGVQDRGDGTAWIVGSEGILLYTSDAGITWLNKGKIADTDLNSVWFSSSTVGFAVGKNGMIRKTTDAGASWSTVTITGLSSQTLYDIEGVGDDLVIVGDKVIVRSQDGGQTWSVSDYSAQNYRFNDVFHPSSLDLWVSGTNDDVKSVILKWQSDPVMESNPPDELVPLIEPPSDISATTNSLVKIACLIKADPNDPCRAVYFYAADGKRHAFPNEKVFFSWYENFDSVKIVSPAFMSSLSLGKNVTYHPGTKMVKFQSSPTVYAVSKMAVLRVIGSEQLAVSLYGTDWNKKIDDISDAFFGNYTFGAKIEKTLDYDVAAEKASVSGLDQNF